MFKLIDSISFNIDQLGFCLICFVFCSLNRNSHTTKFKLIDSISFNIDQLGFCFVWTVSHYFHAFASGFSMSDSYNMVCDLAFNRTSPQLVSPPRIAAPVALDHSRFTPSPVRYLCPPVSSDNGGGNDDISDYTAPWQEAINVSSPNRVRLYDVSDDDFDLEQPPNSPDFSVPPGGVYPVYQDISSPRFDDIDQPPDEFAFSRYSPSSPLFPVTPAQSDEEPVDLTVPSVYTAWQTIISYKRMVSLSNAFAKQNKKVKKNVVTKGKRGKYKKIVKQAEPIGKDYNTSDDEEFLGVQAKVCAQQEKAKVRREAEDFFKVNITTLTYLLCSFRVNTTTCERKYYYSHTKLVLVCI
jgi:hypothetical protein